MQRLLRGQASKGHGPGDLTKGEAELGQSCRHAGLTRKGTELPAGKQFLFFASEGCAEALIDRSFDGAAAAYRTLRHFHPRR